MEQGRNSKHLYMTPVHTFQSPISGSGYAVDRYRLISQGSLDEVDSNATLEFISNEWISPFSIIRKAGNGEIIDFVSDENTEKSFSLRVVCRPITSFQINFDRESGKTFGVTPVDSMASNLITMLSLLSDTSSHKSIEYIEPFIRHDLHFVRWEAIRTTFSIDEKAGLKLLKNALSDPHGHVRKAAAATLEKINI